MFLCNINLLVVVHLCPIVPTHAKTAALTASSKSASCATVRGKKQTHELYVYRQMQKVEEMRTNQRVVTAELQQKLSESLLYLKSHLSSYVRASGKRNQR